MAEAADAPPKRSNICGRSEDELMRELMDDRNAFLLLAQDADRPALSPRENYTVTNKLISTVYSGPTIGDVAAALAMSSSGGSGEYSGSHGYLRSCRIALPEKGFNKMEGKFTTRVKCSSNGSIADDGYKWRKYGQKFIKNSPHPRSYYRCTNPRCNAKKQVERSAEDPEALVVTYEGLHLHFAFSHFLLPRAPWDAATIAAAPTFLSVKRAKVDDTRAALQASKLQEAPAGSFASAASAGSPAGLAVEGSCSLPEPGDQADAAAANIPVVKRDEALFGNAQSSLEPAPEGARGLLEDVVPGLVRNPCSSSSSSSGADVGVLSDLAASLFSGPSSPPSSSAPSSPFSWPLFDDLYALSMPSSPTSTSSSSAPFSWPHDPSFFDMAMLAGAVGAETHVAT